MKGGDKRSTSAQRRPRRAQAQGAGFMPGPRAETKQRLLAGTMHYLREHGVGDVTLRQLAEQLGTSHRLLIYHFGTKEDLLMAVVAEIEREQQDWLLSLREEQDRSPLELLDLGWERLRDPQQESAFRLFVEIYGHALQGRAHATGLLDTLVVAWLEPIGDIFRRMGLRPTEARIHARLFVAMMRGVMLDLLTTGDVEEIKAAWDHHLSQYDKLPGAHRRRERDSPASRKRRTAAPA